MNNEIQALTKELESEFGPVIVKCYPADYVNKPKHDYWITGVEYIEKLREWRRK